MNNKRYMLFSFILIVVFIVSMSSSFATDLSDVDKISEESTGNDGLIVDDEDDEDHVYSFTDLQDLIDSNDNGTVDLEHDYAYYPILDDESLKDGVVFNHTKSNDDYDDEDDEDDDYDYGDDDEDDEDDDYDYGDDDENFMKSFTIYGNGHIIYGNGARIFSIGESENIFIKDLVFVNIDSENILYGGAIYNKGDLTLENCTFIDCHASKGGAIYNKCRVFIDSCIFINNTAVNDGGAIYNSLPEDGEFYSCEVILSHFSDNKAKKGGAIYNSIVSHCYFTGNNTAENSGNNMYYGVKMACTEESSSNRNYYNTVDSSGFSFEVIKYKIKSNIEILIDVLVTDNLSGEPVSGVCVNVEYEYKESIITSNVTNDAGIASFVIDWTYYDDDYNYGDDDEDDDYNYGDDDEDDDYNYGDDEDDDNESATKILNIYLNSYLFNDEVISYEIINPDDCNSLSFKLNKCIIVSDSEVYLEVLVTNNSNNNPVSDIFVDACLVILDDIGWDDDIGSYDYIDKQIATDENGLAYITIKCEDFEDYYVEEFTLDMNLEISLGYSAYNDTTISDYLGKLANVNSSVVFQNDIVFDYGLTGSSPFTLDEADEIKVSVKGHTEAVLRVDNNTLYVSGLEPGNYILLAETVPYYYVNPYNTTLNISVRKVSSISFNTGMVFEYGSSGVIHMVVEGGTVSRNNIEVVGHPEAFIRLSNNVITVSNLPVGSYTLRVVSTPEQGSSPAIGTTSINVRKATAVIKASKLTVAYKKGSKWIIKLVDSKTGKPISNMKLTLKVFTGKKYKTVKIRTNSKGEATYKTKSLSKGKHKVIVSATHSGYNFNTLTSSIKVIKQKTLKFKVYKKTLKDGASLSIEVTRNKKPINGVKVKLLIYTGKKLTKTVILKTKKEGKKKGVVGYATNELSVGTHKVVIMPVDIKYAGNAKSSMKITKKAKRHSKITTKVSG